MGLDLWDVCRTSGGIKVQTTAIRDQAYSLAFEDPQLIKESTATGRNVESPDVARKWVRIRTLETLISKQHYKTMKRCQPECWLLEMEINKTNSLFQWGKQERKRKKGGERRRVPRGAARAAGAGAGESERPSNPAARSPGAALAAAAARLSVPSRRPAPSAGLNLPFAHFARSAGEQLVPGNMQRAWILLTLGLVALVSAESRAELTSDKDMYLDNSSIEEASGVYPIDDDDYASASGSGADEDIESPELTTSRPIPRISFTSAVPKVETTTLKTQSKMPAQTKSPEEIDKEEVHMPDSERKMDPADEDTNVYTEKHSDNLFKRTEVLAAVIAGGVIGFLFAIFLILLLVYRMRKKDEGSYDLGERKPSSAAYQKAPTKEFYA
ncbi:syndecan-2 [Dipodomys spectabilis]|uniref:syndecan-2 n=1 Tax=Dipodomys spectabilis TaxID=105255 RepID=UPI001C54AA6B|nr:syndecan-2 [Dipodomys spectabilis]